ncbi:acyl-CoA dehydrogenase family protein [Mesorhizobium sp. M0136]
MYLTETQEQVREMARAFADEMIRPVAEELDREERVSTPSADEFGVEP